VPFAYMHKFGDKETPVDQAVSNSVFFLYYL